MSDAAGPLAVLMVGIAVVICFALYYVISDNGASKRAVELDDAIQADILARFSPPVEPKPVELVVELAIVPTVIDVSEVPQIPVGITSWLAFDRHFPTAAAAEAAMHTGMTEFTNRMRREVAAALAGVES